MPNNSASNTSERHVDHAHSQATEVASRKKTVLEGHGYYLGNPIGSGTYATVKVNSK